MKQQNTVFHLSSRHCKHRHQCFSCRHLSTTKIKVFASTRKIILTELWNALPKNKFQFAISHEHKLIICSIISYQVANIGTDIILASFKFANNCKFLKIFESISDLQMLHAWKVILYRFQRQEFICPSWLFTKGKNKQKSQSFFTILVI